MAVGHLDTDSGPAVFAGLPELKRGRIVKARRADGRIAVYTVDKIKSYEKAHFPSQEVYGARGRPELRLITAAAATTAGRATPGTWSSSPTSPASADPDHSRTDGRTGSSAFSPDGPETPILSGLFPRPHTFR